MFYSMQISEEQVSRASEEIHERTTQTEQDQVQEKIQKIDQTNVVNLIYLCLLMFVNLATPLRMVNNVQ